MREKILDFLKTETNYKFGKSVTIAPLSLLLFGEKFVKEKEIYNYKTLEMLLALEKEGLIIIECACLPEMQTPHTVITRGRFYMKSEI